MGKVKRTSGGPVGHVRAGSAIPTDTVFKWTNVENEVELCNSGDECDGICIAGVLADEILNTNGECYFRTDTGVYDDVTIDSNFTAGNEWMSGASGVVTAFVNAGDNRALGKFRTSGNAGDKGKITLYSK